MSSESQEGPLKLGSTFLGKYEIRALIGRGGHACVYHAVNSFMGRHVAIKVLHRPGGIDRDALRRGQAEAQILNRLRHDNIVEVSDAGMTEEGLLYIVMEHLRGRSLREALVDHGRLAVEEVLEVAMQIAEGVHAAHLTGAIHRDLKPENVFLTARNRVKILDFGIAKVADAAAWTTGQDIAHGTVLYMSPEQLQLQKLTPKSDIYALGVIMYEALVGRHPTSHLIDDPWPNFWAIVATVLTKDVPFVHVVDPEIPREVSLLVARCMAKHPDGRFASMQELAGVIRQCLGQWTAFAQTRAVQIQPRDLSRKASATSSSTPGDAALSSEASGEELATDQLSGPMFLGALSDAVSQRRSEPGPTRTARVTPEPPGLPRTPMAGDPLAMATGSPVTTTMPSGEPAPAPARSPAARRAFFAVLVAGGLLGLVLVLSRRTPSPEAVASATAPAVSALSSLSSVPAAPAPAPLTPPATPTTVASAMLPLPSATALALPGAPSPATPAPRAPFRPKPASRSTTTAATPPAPKPEPAAASPASEAAPDSMEERLRRLEHNLGPK